MHEPPSAAPVPKLESTARRHLFIEHCPLSTIETPLRGASSPLLHVMSPIVLLQELGERSACCAREVTVGDMSLAQLHQAHLLQIAASMTRLNRVAQCCAAKLIISILERMFRHPAQLCWGSAVVRALAACQTA